MHGHGCLGQPWDLQAMSGWAYISHHWPVNVWPWLSWAAMVLATNQPTNVSSYLLRSMHCPNKEVYFLSLGLGLSHPTIHLRSPINPTVSLPFVHPSALGHHAHWS